MPSDHHHRRESRSPSTPPCSRDLHDVDRLTFPSGRGLDAKPGLHLAGMLLSIEIEQAEEPIVFTNRDRKLPLVLLDLDDLSVIHERLQRFAQVGIPQEHGIADGAGRLGTRLLLLLRPESAVDLLERILAQLPVEQPITGEIRMLCECRSRRPNKKAQDEGGCRPYAWFLPRRAVREE